ncbi:MAG: hypothetical protein J6126_01055 [Clostridia bacterium]|nr:hypothetical protein [Clostridia bacterium]
MSDNLTLIALILLLASGGDISLTQTLLLFALLSTNGNLPDRGNRNCGCTSV